MNNVNLTPAEAALILTVLDNNTLAHSIFPMPDTPIVMDLTLSIITKFRKSTKNASSEQETHDARARKLLEDL